MAGDTSFSQSQLLSSLVMLYQSLQEYLLKFSQASNVDFMEDTSFTWVGSNGEENTMTIPSIGYIKSDITSIKDQLESLISNNDDIISLKYKDGTVRSFEMKKVSQLIDALNGVSDTSFSIPQTIKYKNNWMFESFLNPLLVLPVDVTSLISDTDIKKFSVRRVILNKPTESAIKIFTDSFSGHNDLDYYQSLAILNNYGIKFNLDDNEYELASAINAKRGNFSVLRKTTTKRNDGSNIILYELDKLYYVNVLSKDSSGYTSLNRGDVLLTSDDTEYEIVDINVPTRQVSLVRRFGHSNINVGVDVLKIKPEAYRVPELQVNVGYNEYELIFVKPISNQLDLTTDQWTKGFAIYTNDLSIQLNDGSTIGLPEYYDKYVSDFGMVLLNSAKEKEVPAAIGIKPDSPILDPANLSVVCINRHVSDSEESSQLLSQMSTVASTKKEISGYNDEIEKKKASIGKDNATVESTQVTQKEIAALTEKKRNAQNLLSTSLSSIASAIQNGNNVVVSPKYRIRGYVNIPEPKMGEYGKQEVIQMIISYRYTSLNGSSANNNTMTIIDSEGNKVSAFYPQWNEIRSCIRKKVYDEKLGIYVWGEEDLSDANTDHINLVDIPITRGEIVEIRAKAVSEAGYPLNPLESEWSDVVSISFPAEFEAANESEYLAEQYLIENAISEFNQELIARGLDDHLSDTVFINDRHFVHSLDNIWYGYSSLESTRLISAKEKIDELEKKINALSASVTTTYGSINVMIYDMNEGSGIPVVVENNSKVLFTNVYSKANGGYNGHILGNTYTVKITNPAQTLLELVSYFGDGSGAVPDSEGSTYNDYAELKYDKVPIHVYSNQNPDYETYTNKLGYQSKQVKNQFVFFRYNDLEGNPLYYEPDMTGVSESKDGWKIHNFVINPDKPGQLNLWCEEENSLVNSNSYNPTEFCVDSSMPKKYLNGANTWADVEYPVYNNSYDKSKYMNFLHTKCMSLTDGFRSDETGMVYYQQAAYFNKVLYPGDTERNESNYAAKICFDTARDVYFIGKNTCGMYLYPSIKERAQINVDDNSKKLSGDMSVSFEIKVQYRLTDRADNIGGVKDNESVAYVKRLGVDIYRNSVNSPRFSFDIEVKCMYK